MGAGFIPLFYCYKGQFINLSVYYYNVIAAKLSDVVSSYSDRTIYVNLLTKLS